jgi:flagellar hook protein FlgE
MASTTAMYTGLSGLNANARSLDVIGNNIANANTTAFKSSRMVFATAISRTLGIGGPPEGDDGGTNPFQIGLGVTTAGTQRDFSSGALSTTGDGRDLAIDGNGLFILNRAGNQVYSRAGGFRQNATNDLVNIDGDNLRGFGVDSNFNVVPGTLVNLNVPVGQMTLAQATRNVNVSGNLNAAGALPTQGTRVGFNPFTLLSGPIGGPGGPALALNSLLAGIADPANPGNALFSAGETLRLSGAEKGRRQLPDASLPITATTTVQDMNDFLVAALGINTSTGPNPNGSNPGIALDGATGTLTMTGNTGTVNDIELDASDLRVLDPAGSPLSTPFSPTTTAMADGESIRTTFVAYDSLGSPVNVNLSMVLDSKSNAGTRWRYYAESADDTDVALQVGTGTLDFDQFGQLTTTTPVQLQVDRAGTGAVEPLTFDVAFASSSGNMTALADTNSAISATFQDGTPLGTLAAFSVGPDGIITGAFTNGATRTLGQVALAVFANPEGLVDAGSNLFTVGANSGTPVVATPQSLGAGRIVSGALELSNVDLSREFINLIQASTGYSASSRVITTTDQLMQQLLVLGR